MPSVRISSDAFLLGLAKLISIVLSDVPASEPCIPRLANKPRVVTVSSNDTPNWLATAADCWRPRERPRISVAEALAPLASTSATLPASLPFNLKAFSAWAAIVAASATSIWPALASDITPFDAASVSLTDKPAFDSSVIAFAASLALTPGKDASWPSSRALAATMAICCAVAPDTDLNMFKPCS